MWNYLVNDNVQSNVSGYLLFQYLIDIYPPLITKSKTKQLLQQSWLPPLRKYGHAYHHRPVSPFVATGYRSQGTSSKGKRNKRDNGEGKNSAIFSGSLPWGT